MLHVCKAIQWFIATAFHVADFTECRTVFLDEFLLLIHQDKFCTPLDMKQTLKPSPSPVSIHRYPQPPNPTLSHFVEVVDCSWVSASWHSIFTYSCNKTKTKITSGQMLTIIKLIRYPDCSMFVFVALCYYFSVYMLSSFTHTILCYIWPIKYNYTVDHWMQVF